MKLELNRSRLRRLRILQQLHMAYPEPLSGQVLLTLLRDDPDLIPNLSRVRRSLQYLHDRNLVELINRDEKLWMARLTPRGVDYLEGPEPGVAGVAHPSEFGK